MSSIDMAGGVITPNTPFRCQTDKGIVTEFHWLATCEYTGEQFNFPTKSAAIHWLWLGDEVHGSRAYRQRIIDGNVDD